MLDITKLRADDLRPADQILAEDFASGLLRCRGPRVLTPLQFAAGMAKRKALRDAVDPEGLRTMAQGLIAVFDGDDAAIAAIEADEAIPVDLATELQRVAVLLDRRRPCGEDLGVLRAQSGEPLDGKRHTQTCPRCGEARDWWPAVAREMLPTLQAERTTKLADVLA
mgnify:CR=1 FL=1